jgi:hypothetical protein
MTTVMEMINKREWMQEIDESSLLSAKTVLDFLEENQLDSPAIFGGETFQEDYGITWQMEWNMVDSHATVAELTPNSPEGDNKYSCFYLKLLKEEEIGKRDYEILDTDELSEALDFIKTYISPDIQTAKEKK